MTYKCPKCGFTTEQPYPGVEVYHQCPKARKAMSYLKLKEAK